jgi:hypothetical protein
MEQGRAAFNRGEFFLAHELWEELWLELRELPDRSRALRLRVQGLIQIAAGLHHLQGGRRRPATTLLCRGLAKLTPVQDAPVGESNERQAEDQADLVDRTEPLAAFWPEAAAKELCRDLARFIAQLEDQRAIPPDPGLLKFGVGGGRDSEPEEGPNSS